MRDDDLKGIRERIDPRCLQLPRQTAEAAMSAQKAKTFQQQRRRDVLAPPRPPAGETAPAVANAGGTVVDQMKHPLFQTFERQYRIEPKEGWFSANVSRATPIIFNLGSYEVPADQTLWLFDYEFSVYRPSGLDPGDFVKAEEGRFSNQMGFDLKIGNSRPGDLMFELVPHVAIPGGTAFTNRKGRATAGQFSLAQARSFALTAGPGTSTLPVRRAVQGPEGSPFTFIAEEGQIVSLGCVIFSQILSPLACIQGNLRGYRMTSVLNDKLLGQVRP